MSYVRHRPDTPAADAVAVKGYSRQKVGVGLSFEAGLQALGDDAGKAWGWFVDTASGSIAASARQVPQFFEHKFGTGLDRLMRAAGPATLRDINAVAAFAASMKGRRLRIAELATRSLSRTSASIRCTCGAAAAGFTLIELLVVLTIIGLIMGLIGPRVLGYLEDSRAKTAKLQIESLSSALDLFYLDAGRYPTTSEGLDALAQRPSDIAIWNGPYIKGGRVPADPWGHPYQYRSPVDHTPPYEIVSFGSDGREGGSGNAADISNVEH
jgi:general secretion pathway protein G